VLDLQLPRPLLNPGQWPTGGVTLLALSHLKYGGPLSERRRNSRIAFAIPDLFWSVDILNETSFIPVLQTEFEKCPGGLELVSKAELNARERGEWLELAMKANCPLRFVSQPDLKTPTLLDWSKEIFPKSSQEAGDVQWFGELREYEMQLGISKTTASMDSLRFWPGFLKNRKLHFASVVATEWALAQALFSPQDDSQGFGETAVLNPTLEIVTDMRESQPAALGFWRVDGTLNSHTIEWE
jgi:hypothetical protein